MKTLWVASGLFQFAILAIGVLQMLKHERVGEFWVETLLVAGLASYTLASGLARKE